MKQRVVVDTSTLVGAALRANSTPRRALRRAMELYELCVSAEILDELEAVLARPRFSKYGSRETLLSFVEFVRKESRLFPSFKLELAEIVPRCRDAGDDHILALAWNAEVDLIISSDNDLLVLNPWRGIPILTPAQFLAQFTIEDQR